MRTHCEIGYNTLTRIPFLREAADIVFATMSSSMIRAIHGLRGEQISPGARIISIANALDAMLSDCHYRRYALPMSHAREEIRRCANKQFDLKLVEVFLSMPESHWIDLRESLGPPFCLTHSRNTVH